MEQMANGVLKSIDDIELLKKNRDVSESPPKDHRLTKDEIIVKRKQLIGPQCSVFFNKEPLNIVRAYGQYVLDEKSIQYLDCISNVQHVGHCHPVVSQEISDQLDKSNCNSRFLHENLVLCAEKIKATMPPELDTVFFCNSGSEANDLALRLSQDFTDGTEVICVDHAYHGHLLSTIDISPYKFNGTGGRGKADYVYVAPCPDVFRGKHRLPDSELNNSEQLTKMGSVYAEEVKKICQDIKSKGRKLRSFIMESLQSCGGQVIPPPSYLRNVIKYVHEFGGLVIADEVQTGFGRVGSKFWAFQLQGDDVIPDIVTMGKPMGNGFPVSAVVTKREIANKFGRGMEYFNTFGGNPVSCAAVLGVFKVIEEEKLMLNAEKVGQYLLERLRELQSIHNWIIGDVRGVGLFAGIDLVRNNETRDPATKEAQFILYRMKNKCIILSVEGPYSNIIKIKPPICFSKKNVDELVEHLDDTIGELAAQRVGNE
jgi:ethanolamine-phosphate phospho-lyase